MNQNQLQQAAINYTQAGFSTLPINAEKRPTVKSWTEFQTVRPTPAQINQWFGGAMPEAVGIAVIAGEVSGNIELIDVDSKYDSTGELMAEFSHLIKEHLPELFPKLAIARTVNGGFHFLYRAPADAIQGNKKLASRPATETEAAKGDKTKVLIETRGRGGFFAVAPTRGYSWLQNSFTNLPLITAEERETLMSIARSFDKMPVKEAEAERTAMQQTATQTAGGLSPFEDYNERADVTGLLERHGWRFHRRCGSRIIFTRPGNTDQKSSANFCTDRRIFYVFTTGSDFRADRGYNAAQVYTQLEHGGDYSAAAKQLYKEGYGARRKKSTPVGEEQKPQNTSSLMAENFTLLLSDADGQAAGVYYENKETSGKLHVCSPLEIVAETQTETGENYGRFLRWSDSKGRVKNWAMPLELVHGDGFELIKYLVSRGLLIGASRNHHDKLKNYINLSQPTETIICTTKIGWHNDEGIFVFPDETIGASESTIVYQPEYATAHKFATKGTLEEWQENISKYCIGNTRLAFGVSLAFAAPLLPIVEMQSGGFHNRGGTSSGKTTVSFVAGSVVGGSSDELGYCQSWKATANGLESVAEMHNHSLLCLDELAQIDGRQAGDVGYMLANGEGKKRMAKTITARRSLSWQLLFLSTGEISLADKMSEAGLTIKGGQEVRVLDIPAETGKFGVFENLHEFPDGQSFADYLRSASRKFYGSAIREFLNRFTELGTPHVKNGWHEFSGKFIEKILPKNNKYPSEVYRAAGRFALVAFAGEMATKLGITKWQAGEAAAAAEAIFQAWFDNRNGRGTSDAERALSQIRAFIEAHGSSRFEMLTSTDESLDTTRIINRAGFRKTNDASELEYLFLPEIFRAEVCRGFDYKFVCKILDERGFLRSDPKGFQKQLKYGGVGIRPYWISSRILQDVDDSSENGKVADGG